MKSVQAWSAVGSKEKTGINQYRLCQLQSTCIICIGYNTIPLVMRHSRINAAFCQSSGLCPCQLCSQQQGQYRGDQMCINTNQSMIDSHVLLSVLKITMMTMCSLSCPCLQEADGRLPFHPWALHHPGPRHRGPMALVCI